MKRILFIVGSIALLIISIFGIWYFGFGKKGKEINFSNLFSNKNSSSDQWTLKLESSGRHTTVVGTCNGSGEAVINFEISQKSQKIAMEGSWSEQGDCSGGNGSGTSQIKGKIGIKGEVKNNQLVFQATYKEESCQVILNTAIGNYTSNECDPNAIPAPHQITIDLRDNAEATETYQQSGEGWSTITNEKWRLTKGCGENLPELKSAIEELLDASINAGEAPDQTHEKLMVLVSQRMPLGRIFKIDNDCPKIAGVSVDLMYKIDDREDSIFKTIGSLDGQAHRIISGSVDKTVARGGRESQVYYRATIDISLE